MYVYIYIYIYIYIYLYIYTHKYKSFNYVLLLIRLAYHQCLDIFKYLFICKTCRIMFTYKSYKDIFIIL